MIKQGAMFGLDARIALAIFGALSVISGASLYGVIKNANLVSLRTEVDNIIKATEQLYLDIGELPLEGINDNYIFRASYLFRNNSSLINWKGPYYPFKYSRIPPYETSVISNNKIAIAFRKGDPSYTNCGGTGGFTGASLVTPYILILQYKEVRDPASPSECLLTESFAKEFHDKYDSDGNYYRGNIRLSIESPNDALIAIKISENLFK